MFQCSRSGYYKSLMVRQQKAMVSARVTGLVQAVRKCQPRIGGKKLYKLLGADLLSLERKVGRDKFFDVLRSNGLLVKRYKRYEKTTDSHHWFRKYKNRIKDKRLNAPNQAYVSDITYIRLKRRFAYLFLITDAYSRKIVGWHLSGSLAVEGALSALHMAIRQCPDTRGVIHHSDRGIQYCIYQPVVEPWNGNQHDRRKSLL
jgi:putative transposase